MTATRIIKYGCFCAAAFLLTAGVLFGVEWYAIHRSGKQQAETDLFAQRAMLRLWHAPIADPEPHEVKKLLTLCAYASPHTRHVIKSPADTYRFLDMWQEAIEQDGMQVAEAIALQCRLNPVLVDPTPPQILRRNAIIAGDG